MTPPNRPDKGPLDQADQLQELGKVAGELLHDLAGMLSVVSGRVALAREEAALGRVAEEDLGWIQEDTNELRRMVIEILEELDRAPRSLEVTFPVTETLEQVVNRWLVGAPAVATTLHSTLPAGSEVVGPRSFFVRSMANLLRNAARHARTRVRLTLSPVRDDRWVEILVEDDGDGVARELGHGIFEPFVSGSGLGTGLGLSFARWGVERLGGELSLAGPAQGLGGASFRVLLPLTPIGRTAVGRESRERKRSPTARQLRPDGTLSGLSVTVVDDDSAVRKVFVRLLDRAGARAGELDPKGWGTAGAAVDRLRDESPDVILLDLNLGAISGLDVHAALVDRAPELAGRILFLTGGLAPEPAPARPVVNKLVTWDELSAWIRQVARESSGP